ncbi:hydrogenase expression/formation C-terminal domain-containing protein [Thiobaca trueperi]|uniref:HupH hydrogenase expression protein n=1 Tax=Thiobaca trueperi TaxID=127458 RepID=A0A4R3MS41_9GAMM|nr:hydrogenase expression/formation C-terminal domain-containing protein [Thiobaca trueperi]TCT19190.1 HupH hydrogenase expression protein [Thiobaca trueperi]
MTKLSDIPVRIDRPRGSRADVASVTAILTELSEMLANFVETGQPGVIDLRQRPRMRKATYQTLKDALATGEVSAVVDTESKVEVLETQYPGVWWVTHRDERGGILTELIEITAIPAILRSHSTEIQAGLRRLQRRLAESVPTRESVAAMDETTDRPSDADNGPPAL